MTLDVAAVQAALAEDGLDAWLLYDFRGANPIAARMAGLADVGKMATRRWFYLIPRTGEPRALVHAIERYNLDHLPGEKTVYGTRASLSVGLDRLLNGLGKVAMEYAAGANNPYVSRVDAGTIEAIRQRGVEVVSSGDLAQRFEACWDASAIDSHRKASSALYRIKDRAFELIRSRLAAGTPTTEYDIQEAMLRWYDEESLEADAPPNVSAQENAGNPHYLPTRDGSRTIGKNELVLIDLWAKLRQPGAVYADICWVAYTGAEPPEDMEGTFNAAVTARDAAVEFVQSRLRAGQEVRGFEVDQVARGVLERCGYGDRVMHRTGHSLGVDVHGNGVHMDDYETRDERRLLPGAGFTVEPGLYNDVFGVRTEINVVVGDRDATVTGPRQERLLTLTA